jgi:preprotein translocase subunit SecF
MQFIKSDVNINFIGKRKFAYVLSLIMLVVSIASLVFKGGPEYGVDFAGGTVIQVKFSSPVGIDSVKTGLASGGIQKTSVQRFGEQADNEFLLRTETISEVSEGFTSRLQDPNQQWALTSKFDVSRWSAPK